MKAKSNRFNSIIAFGGNIYVATEWRDVPAGCEDEAISNPYLDVQEDELEPVVFSPTEPIAVEPPGKRKRRGQR